MSYRGRWLVLFTSAFWLWPVMGAAEESGITMAPVRIDLPAEALHDLDIQLPLTDGLYKAEILPAEPPSEELILGFFDPAKKGDPRAIDASQVLKPEDLLHLRVLAERCCPSGTYERTIQLVPQQASAWPVQLPVHITVQGSFWTCHRPALVFFLVFAGGALLHLYLYGMVDHSQFLHPRRLALSLRPLLRDGMGGFIEDSQHEVETLVLGALPRRRRILNWLQANPLIFGLPGGSYHETVELHLQVKGKRLNLRLSLKPHRHYRKILEKQPHLGHGRLFAAASTSRRIRFFAVPQNGRVGDLILKNHQEENSQLKLVAIEPDQDLLRSLDDDAPPMTYAGVRIGGRA